MKRLLIGLVIGLAVVAPLRAADGVRLHELTAISTPGHTNIWVPISDLSTTNTYRMPLNLVGTWLGLTKGTDWDTSAEILAHLNGDKSGSGKLVFDTLPTLIAPYISGWGNANHNHLLAETGGKLDAAAIGYGTIDPARLPAGVLSADYADRTLVVDGTNGNDATAVRGRQDLAYQTIAAAVTNLQSGDLLVIRPGTYTVTRPGMAPNSSLYSSHTYANFVLKNLTNVTILGHGAVVASTGLGNVWSIVDCENVSVWGLTQRGPGMNPVIAAQICGEFSLWGTNQNLSFHDVVFEDYPNHGILVSQLEKTSFNTLVEGCSFVRGGTTNHTALGVDGAGVAVSSFGLRVVSTYADRVTRVVEIEGSGTLPKGGAVISGFVFTNIINQGIVLLETSGVGSRLTDVAIGPGVIAMDKTAHTALGQYGITASGGRNISVQNVTVTGALNTGFSFGTSHADLRRSGFRGCTAVNCGVSFAITDALNRGIFDNYVEHCQAIASTTAQGGIVVAGNATTVRGNTVADSAGYGVYVIPNGAGTAGTVNVMVTDNLIRTPGFHAIGIAANTVGTVVEGNNLTYASNKISDGGTGTRIDVFDTLTVSGALVADTVSDASGDLRTGLSAAVSSISSLWESLDNLNLLSLAHFTGAGTNTAVVGLENLFLEGPPSVRMDAYAGGSVLLDLDQPGFRITATNTPLAIGYVNAPDTTGRQKSWPITVSNAHSAVLALEYGSATPVSQVGFDTLETNAVVELRLYSQDNVLTYQYVGPQTAVLQPELGGTGETGGEARAPLTVVAVPTYSGVGLTNVEIDYAAAKTFRLDNTKDALLKSTASRLASSATNHLEQIRYLEMLRPPANRIIWVDTNNFGGAPESNFVAQGSSWRATLVGWGANPGEDTIFGASVTNTPGGGGAALTDLNNYLGAAWLGTNSSGNLTDSTGNGFTGYTKDGFGFTYSQPGHIEANSITNAASGTTGITNATLGAYLRGTNSWTIMNWHRPAAISANRYLAASWNNGIADSWRVFTGTDGTYKMNIYTNSGSGATWETGLSAALAKTHWALAYDKDAKELRMVVNGTQATLSLATVLDSPDSQFSLGGYWSSGVLSTAFRGNLEQVLVYTNYAMPLGDIQRIYNAGTGKAFSTF